jgi:chromosome segregation ATPase
MKFDLKIWAIIGLALIIVLMILFRKPAERTDLTPYRVEIAHQQLVIDSLTKSRSSLNRKIQEDSILQAEEKQAYQKSITGLQARLKDKRVRIDSILVESPALREYVATADSVISFQSARIDSLESDKAELRVNVLEVTANFEAQLSATSQKLKLTEDLAAAYKKEARKAKRGNRWLKSGAVAGVVGALILGSNL